MSFIEQAEEQEMWEQKQGNSESFSEPTFRHKGSTGNNSPKLARILAAYDLCMKILDLPNDLSVIVSAYQASVDSKYHDDFVKIATLHHAIDMLRRSRAATAFSPSNQTVEGQNNHA